MFCKENYSVVLMYYQQNEKSTETKRHGALHLDYLDESNVMVQLMTLLVSYETGSRTNAIT